MDVCVIVKIIFAFADFSKLAPHYSSWLGLLRALLSLGVPGGAGGELQAGHCLVSAAGEEAGGPHPPARREQVSPPRPSFPLLRLFQEQEHLTSPESQSCSGLWGPGMTIYVTHCEGHE